MNNHIPVLTNQILQFLAPREGQIFVDCTLGIGGHTQKISEALNGTGAIYGIEVDERNLSLARERLVAAKNVHFIHDNFENFEAIGKEIIKKEGRIDGILFDLGLSSLHVDEASRGFSFQKDGPLDMRFDPRQETTAADIINEYSEEELIEIFKTYGEERFSNSIARNIVDHRKRNRFTTTLQLANFIESCVGGRRGGHAGPRIHPATRVFQALRIATNREIEVLHIALASAISMLGQGGRIVVISYHSLEDRLVKNMFRDAKKALILNVLTKKPIKPDVHEIASNRRSRSACLRAAEKL